MDVELSFIPTGSGRTKRISIKYIFLKKSLHHIALENELFP
jgi:hypothetical protein